MGRIYYNNDTISLVVGEIQTAFASVDNSVNAAKGQLKTLVSEWYGAEANSILTPLINSFKTFITNYDTFVDSFSKNFFALETKLATSLETFGATSSLETHQNPFESTVTWEEDIKVNATGAANIDSDKLADMIKPTLEAFDGVIDQFNNIITLLPQKIGDNGDSIVTSLIPGNPANAFVNDEYANLCSLRETDIKGIEDSISALNNKFNTLTGANSTGE